MPKPPEPSEKRAARRPGPEPAPEAGPLARQGRAGLSPSHSLRGLRKLLKAVFVDQLRLRREGPHLKIALESAATTVPAALPAAAAAAAALSPMAQKRHALGELLDSRAGSRAVLKHLAALEHQLAHCEGPFIHDLSLSTLQHMLRQLHGLIAPPAPPGIAMLLAELLDAAELKLRLEQEAEARSQAISSFFVDHKLEVKELSPSTLELPGVAEAEGKAE